MFKVFMVNENEFIVTGLDQPFGGSQIKTIAFLLQMGVDEKEIEFGLSELISKDHHVADFGIDRTFIYTRRVA